jgi:hypothetical protein
MTQPVTFFPSSFQHFQSVNQDTAVNRKSQYRFLKKNDLSVNISNTGLSQIVMISAMLIEFNVEL